MGKIEKELRALTRGEFDRMSDAALRVCIAAAYQMGATVDYIGSDYVDDDVMSEAIEAAEALKL